MPGDDPSRSREPLSPEDRAVEWGADEHGWFSGFSVDGVFHRLRYIAAGTFWMGSPESERGRRDNEGPRHLVTIAEGFWLGETPVTQALWKAVMGYNPSEFADPERPVERVSWNDCGRFIAELNRRVPGLDARLPLECEWEHACRAGTETATWAGDLDYRGPSNVPRLDPIAWYSGNSGRDFDPDEGPGTRDEDPPAHEKRGTRRVAMKAANPWGLYDMLGNVNEWCADMNDADPGDTAPYRWRRVVRGGSWLIPAEWVRAAYRHALGPGSRNPDLGFRLARGPGALKRSA